MKILGCMPTHKAMDIEAVKSLVKMQRDIFNCGDDFELMSYNGFNPYFSRNKLLKTAIQLNPDWVLSIDSDHVYSKGLLYSLIERNLDFVSAKYYVSGGVGLDSRSIAMGNWTDGKFRLLNPREDEKGLVEVDVAGFGFAVIKPSMLKEMYKDGDSFMTPSGTLYQTDDVLFCKRAKDCGFKIFYDSNVMIGHLSTTTSI